MCKNPRKSLESPIYGMPHVRYYSHREPPAAGTARCRQAPDRTKQEGNTMKDFEMRYVGSHVEVYTGSGVFLFSADTVREAMEELAE